MKWSVNVAEIGKTLKSLLASADQGGGINQSIGGHNWPLSIKFDAEMRFLSAASDGAITKRLAIAALDKMLDQSLTSADDFVRILNEIRSELSARTTDTSWTFYLPMRLKVGVDFSSMTFCVLGNDFEAVPWTTAIAHIAPEQLRGAFSGVPGFEIPRPVVAFKVSTRAADAAAGWLNIEQSFDVLRGSIELLVNRGRVQLFSVGDSHPRRVFVPPQFMIAEGEGHGIGGFRFDFDDPHGKSPEPIELSDQFAETLTQFLAAAVGAPSNDQRTTSLIADALRLYGQAMDRQQPHFCFLNLWQIGEVICLADAEHGSSKLVSSRLAFLASAPFRRGPAYLNPVLEQFAKKRHKVVHRGIHGEVSDDDVTFMKICCEVGMHWLIDRHEKLPTRSHLGHFYKFIDKNKVDLSAIVDAAEFVKSIRDPNN